jgi:hypothetical protein
MVLFEKIPCIFPVRQGIHSGARFDPYWTHKVVARQLELLGLNAAAR